MPFHAGKFLLTLHVTVSVAFVGAVAVFFALALIGLFAADAETERVGALANALITGWVIVPLCLASLASGIVESLGTSWGLLRHYWVAVKLVLTALTTLILLLHTRAIDAMARIAEGPDLVAGAHFAERLQLVVASGGGLVVLIAAIALSTYKPRGLTAYGWRKDDARRKIAPA
jgi:hypothetical protein